MIACMIIGLASWTIGNRFQTNGLSTMNAEVCAAVDQTLKSDLDPSAWWAPVNPVELLEFRRRVRNQLGTLTTASATQLSLSVSAPARAHYRVMLESPTIQTFASVEVDVGSDLATLLPTVRLRSINIGSPDTADTEGSAPQFTFTARDNSAAPATLTPK